MKRKKRYVILRIFGVEIVYVIVKINFFHSQSSITDPLTALSFQVT